MRRQVEAGHLRARATSRRPQGQLRWRDRSDFAWWLRWQLARLRAHRRA
jgi:hypothetical protein